VDETRPELRVIDELLGVVAQHHVDDRAHVLEAATVGDLGSSTSM